MTGRQSKFLTDTGQLRLPCRFTSKSRCSSKSHSSTCLSTPYESKIFEGGEPYSKDEEFPRLLTPSPADEGSPTRKKRKKKKKVFTVDVVPTTKVVVVGSRHHKCRLHRDRGGGSGRERLHSDSSCRTKRDSELGGRAGNFEQSKRARLAVVVVALVLIMVSVLLVGVTLRMAPIIDELVRKENEEIYRVMANIPSTAAPTAGSSTVGNDNLTSTGQPG